MDTNLVLPLGSRKCQVIFDYFLDASLKVTSVHIPRIYQTEILVSQLRRIFLGKKKRKEKDLQYGLRTAGSKTTFACYADI